MEERVKNRNCCLTAAVSCHVIVFVYTSLSYTLASVYLDSLGASLSKKEFPKGINKVSVIITGTA